MLTEREILTFLRPWYDVQLDDATPLRDAGSMTYAVRSGDQKLFLRVSKPAFRDTARQAADICAYLCDCRFPVPPIVRTSRGLPCVEQRTAEGDILYTLQAYIEGGDIDPQADAARLGALAGDMHRFMASYPHALIKRDKPYYIGRYLEQMRRKAYPRVDAFDRIGERVWARVQSLPRGFCHGDLHTGNLLKTKDGALHVLDFDTACDGIALYDPALLCNSTDFFTLNDADFDRTRAAYAAFAPCYARHAGIPAPNERALLDAIALYHFSLQATILEIYGLDCVDHAFLDRQLTWLERWLTLCAGV